jgi:hypothetical protein
MRNFVYACLALSIASLSACTKEQTIEEQPLVQAQIIAPDTLHYDNLRVMKLPVAITRASGAYNGEFSVRFEPIDFIENFQGVNNGVVGKLNNFIDAEIAHIAGLKPGVHRGKILVQQLGNKEALVLNKEVYLKVTPTCDYDYRDYKNGSITYNGMSPEARNITCSYELDNTLAITNLFGGRTIYVDVLCNQSNAVMIPFTEKNKTYTATGTINGTSIVFELFSDGLKYATMEINP